MVKKKLMLSLKEEEYSKLTDIAEENSRTKSGQVAYWINQK